MTKSKQEYGFAFSSIWSRNPLFLFAYERFGFTGNSIKKWIDFKLNGYELLELGCKLVLLDLTGFPPIYEDRQDPVPNQNQTSFSNGTTAGKASSSFSSIPAQVASKEIANVLEAVVALIQGPHIQLVVVGDQVHLDQLKQHHVFRMLFNANLFMRTEPYGNIFRVFEVTQRKDVSFQEVNIWNEAKASYTKSML